MMEFLVRIEFTADPNVQAGLRPAEQKRVHELIAEGLLRRLWMIPGANAAWSIWQAPDADALHDVIASLPYYPHLAVDVHELASHPLDPARA